MQKSKPIYKKFGENNSFDVSFNKINNPKFQEVWGCLRIYIMKILSNNSSELHKNFVLEKQKKVQTFTKPNFFFESVNVVVIDPLAWKFWDIESMNQVVILEGHLDSIISLVLMSDGKKTDIWFRW